MIVFDKKIGVLDEFEELCRGFETRLSLKEAEFKKSINLKSLNNEVEYYKYQYNIFDVAQEGKTKVAKLVKILKHNLEQIKNMDSGDVVVFKRGLYSHHAILTGILL